MTISKIFGTCIILALSLQAEIVWAEPYRGPLIDAHNQFGCDITEEEVSNILNRSSLKFTLLSVREVCDKKNPINGVKRIHKVQSLAENRVGLLIPTKIGGNRGISRGGQETLVSLDRVFGANAVGFAEIIIQHPEHEYKNNVNKGTLTTIESSEARFLIDFVKSRAKPIVLHIELRDFPSLASSTINDLNSLLTRVNPHPVVLIHMGQAYPETARALLTSHANLFFLLSTSDPINQKGIRRRISAGEKAQEGWINVFDEQEREISRKKFGDFVSKLRWKEDWRTLIVEHPSRFLFAIDSVYHDPWINNHGMKIELWRKALGDLPTGVAQRVACSNAQALWALPVNCNE